MSIDAFQAIQQASADALRAQTSAYDAINRDRENQRRYLMDRLAQQRNFGDTGEAENTQLNNGDGITGWLRNTFGSRRDNADTGPMVGGGQPISINPDEQSVVDKLVARAKGHGAFETAQSDIMNDRGGKLANVDITKTKNQSGQALDERQKAFILADAESRKNTGKALSLSEFSKMYDDQKYDIGVSEQISQPSTKTLENGAVITSDGGVVNYKDKKGFKDNMMNRNEYANKIADMQAITGDNKAIEEENKKLAETQVKNVEKEEKLQTDIAYKRAVAVPAHKKYQGGFDEQTAQAEDEYYPLINKYVSEGKYDKAELLESKYNVAMTAIYKKFDDKWTDRKLFEKPKGGKGPKFKQWVVTDNNGKVIKSIDVKEGENTIEGQEKLISKLKEKGQWGEGYTFGPAGENTFGTAITANADAEKKQFDTNTEKTANLKTTIDDDLGWWTRLGKSDEERRKAWNEKHPENRIEMEADGMYAMKGGGDSSNVASGNKTGVIQVGFSKPNGDTLVEENVNYKGKVYKGKYKRPDGTYYLE